MIAFLNKHKSKYSISFLILSSVILISLSVFYSCGANIYSVDDDVQLGKEIQQQIAGESGEFPVLQGHQNVKE